MKDKARKDKEFFLRSIVDELGIDILFECFVGLMMKSSLADDKDVHVVPSENNRRNYRNDIIPVPKDEDSVYYKETYFEENEHDYVVMYTSRSSILDYLPEDYSSEPDDSKERFNEDGSRKTKGEMEKYRERVKEERRSAERFFRPLEVEYNKIRIQREFSEINQLENFDQILQLFWNDFPVSNDKWRRFIRTLHLVPHIIGDIKKTEALIEYVLGTPARLILSVEESYTLNKEEELTIKGTEKIMGFNILLGNVIYDYLEICTLKIEGLSTDEFYASIEKGSTEELLLNEIIKNYFPLNVEVKLDFSIDMEQNKNEETFTAPILGYSSKLGT